VNTSSSGAAAKSSGKSANGSTNLAFRCCFNGAAAKSSGRSVSIAPLRIPKRVNPGEDCSCRGPRCGRSGCGWGEPTTYTLHYRTRHVKPQGTNSQKFRQPRHTAQRRPETDCGSQEAHRLHQQGSACRACQAPGGSTRPPNQA